MSKPRRRVYAIAIVAWVVIATVGVGWAFLIEVLDFGYCESSVGDSNFGELSWSVFPPGPVCSWTVASNGFADTRGPTPVMAAWLLTLAVLGLLTIRLGRAARPDPTDEPRPTARAH